MLTMIVIQLNLLSCFVKYVIVTNSPCPAILTGITLTLYGIPGTNMGSNNMGSYCYCLTLTKVLSCVCGSAGVFFTNPLSNAVQGDPHCIV